MGFCLLLKEWAKISLKIELENLVKDLLDHARNSVRIALKTTSKRVIQKTSDLICIKIGNKITKNLSQNNSETNSQTEQKSIEIPIEEYVIPENRKKIIDELRLTQ